MDYQGKIAELESRIFKAVALRDSQVGKSELYGHFQDEVTRLTQEMLAWQENEPILTSLDRNIRRARGVLTQAQRRRDHNDAGTAAKVLGLFGGLLLVIVLLFSPPVLLVVFCIACLGGAGGCVLAAARTRRARDEVVMDAEAVLVDLEMQWKRKAPDGNPWKQNAPVPVGAGQGAFEDEASED
jgi:hypothetical protein